MVLIKEQGEYKLDPNGVTGFVDGEGSFTCSVYENKELKIGWRVEPCFQIVVHYKDKAILEAIQKALGVGKITERGKAVRLRVQSINELKLLIKFFKKYYLLTKKRADFILLCKIIEIIKRGEHLTPEGLRKIIALRAAMN